jgi:hypothetical protein
VILRKTYDHPTTLHDERNIPTMSDYAHVIAETTATDGTPFRVILEPDTDAENPRDNYSNAGVIHVIPQSRYNVPAESSLGDYLREAIMDHPFPVVARWLHIFHGATVVLPIYSNYGRDFNISAGDADEAPEVGNYVGVTFDTAATQRENGWNSACQTLTAAALAADVQTYASWAEGDVWGYVVQRAELDEDGEVIDWEPAGYVGDSCWGFIGQAWAEVAATEALDSAVAEYDDGAAGRAEQAFAAATWRF